MSDEDLGTVWIRTEPTLNGDSYAVTLEVDEDHSVSLNRSRSIKHALAVLTAVEYATMDSIIFKQLSEKVDEQSAIQLVHELRQDRPPIDFSISKPMSLEPGCNAKGEPFLTFLQNGTPVGQWDIEDAKEHALTCLTAFVGADMDLAYRRHLIHTVGLDPSVAGSVVADLVRFR